MHSLVAKSSTQDVWVADTHIATELYKSCIIIIISLKYLICVYIVDPNKGHTSI